MRPTRRAFLKGQLATASLAAWGSALGGPAAAQAFPSRPLRLVLPYAPGGATDLMSRLVATGLTQQLGQPVVVDNRPGATGAVGTGFVANAAPDGYTMLVGFVGSVVLLPLLTRSLPYDPIRDLAPVGRMVNYEFVLVAGPAVPQGDLRALAELAKQRNGSFTYGTTGVGSPLHLVMEQFNRNTAAGLRHVPYPGEQPMVTDLLGGNIELSLLTPQTSAPLIAGGQLRSVAITSVQRSPLLPEVPTFAEAGYPDSSFEAWAGIMVPRRTPSAVIERIGSALEACLKNAALREGLLRAGFRTAPLASDAFADLVRTDIDRYRGLIQAAGLTTQ